MRTNAEPGEDERNPFRVFVPILVLIAGALLLMRLFSSPEKKHGTRRPRSRPLVLRVAAVSQAKPGRNAPPISLRWSNVTVSADNADEDILWLTWDDPNPALTLLSVTDEKGRIFEHTLEQAGPGRAALVIAQGYGAAPKNLIFRGRLDGLATAADGFCTAAVPGFIDEPRILPLSPPLAKGITLTRAALRPTSPTGPDVFSITYRPLDPRTQAVAVKFLKTSYARQLKSEWRYLSPVGGGRFRGADMYLTNGGEVDAAQVQVVELLFSKQSGYVTFAKAGLTPETAHRSITFKEPQVSPGPGKSSFLLKAISASRTPVGNVGSSVGGWLYADIAENPAAQTPLEKELGTPVGGPAEIVFPRASDMGLAKRNYQARYVGRPWVQESFGDVPPPKSLPIQAKSGSLVLQLTVGRPKLLSRRTAIVPIQRILPRMRAPID